MKTKHEMKTDSEMNLNHALKINSEIQINTDWKADDIAETPDCTAAETPALSPAWHCNTYCRKVRHISCEGQKYVKEGAPDQCPYFDEMLY